MGPLASSWSNSRHAVTAIDPHAIHTVDEVIIWVMLGTAYRSAASEHETLGVALGDNTRVPISRGPMSTAHQNSSIRRHTRCSLIVE
jgi:hypothetical protein